MTDLDRKKVFLQQGSELYHHMISLTGHDTVKRYLAFRIIVNAMSFEDLVHDRRHPTMRKIRDALLAHKQEPDFFEAFQAVDHIRRSSIDDLLCFMVRHTPPLANRTLTPLELKDDGVNSQFRNLLKIIFEAYVEDKLSGFRLTNNYLAHTGQHIHEISGSDLAGMFYRYNSSMALFCLSQCIFNNMYECSSFTTSTRHAKLDMILHSQNLADCAIRDTLNRHSIDGLLEICRSEPIGDATALSALKEDASYQRLYRRVRKVRNKLIGHMDSEDNLADLVAALDQLPVNDIHHLVNTVNKAVYDVSATHVVMSSRYHSASVRLDDPNIVDIPGWKPKPYDD